MKMTAMLLTAVLALAGMNAAMAESEGNNLASVERPAGTGTYYTGSPEQSGTVTASSTPAPQPVASPLQAAEANTYASVRALTRP